MKRRLALLLITALCLSGAPLSRAQSQPPGSASGIETVPSEAAKSPESKAQRKSKAKASPKAQIEEGGKEIGKGFKDIVQGIGKGFKNMGLGIKKAWTGGGSE